MTETTTRIPIPKTLETPPRTTGNAVQDFPLVVDWMWRAYQVIQQSVRFINEQVVGLPDITVTNLPDPATSTVAIAQETANIAYEVASQANGKAGQAVSDVAAMDTRVTTLENKVIPKGAFQITAAETGASVSIPTQPDTNYVIMVQPKGIVAGTPASGAYIITGKTYSTTGFSVTIQAAPGAGNTLNYDWILIR